MPRNMESAPIQEESEQSTNNENKPEGEKKEPTLREQIAEAQGELEKFVQENPHLDSGKTINQNKYLVGRLSALRDNDLSRIESGNPGLENDGTEDGGSLREKIVEAQNELDQFVQQNPKIESGMIRDRNNYLVRRLQSLQALDLARIKGTEDKRKKEETAAREELDRAFENQGK